MDTYGPVTLRVYSKCPFILHLESRQFRLRLSDVVKSDVILSPGGACTEKTRLYRGADTFLMSRTISALQRCYLIYLPQLRVQFVGSEFRELPVEPPVLQKARGREMSSAERIHVGCFSLTVTGRVYEQCSRGILLSPSLSLSLSTHSCQGPPMFTSDARL